MRVFGVRLHHHVVAEGLPGGADEREERGRDGADEQDAVAPLRRADARGIVKVTDEHGTTKTAAEWVPGNGRPRLLRKARVTRSRRATSMRTRSSIASSKFCPRA